ncbi:serine/threonine-protein kinase, partial [Mycobacterium talmoniae]|uniref:serine/threonine-protein kinase n=1 Tax=Mycobacterium talmoniae TaxID=1858794 RepID=UPI000A4DEB75
MESFGRYQLLDVVGRGDTGEVFRAEDGATGRAVAVKVLSAQLSADPEFAQRFRDDTRLAADLNDPHIVPIHNYGDIDGRLYVDMRLIEGRDLATVLAHDGRLHPARAVAIIEQVASALDTAHHAGLTHRDLRPSNVLIDARDFAYLTFGATDHAAATGPRADVPALARLLYQCLTGQRLEPGAPAPQLSLTAPDIPPTLDAVIARGVAVNSNEYYQTATELAQAAQAALALPPAAPAQPTPWQPGPMPAARPRRTGLVVAISAAVAVVVVIAGVAGYLV